MLPKEIFAYIGNGEDENTCLDHDGLALWHNSKDIKFEDQVRYVRADLVTKNTKNVTKQEISNVDDICDWLEQSVRDGFLPEEAAIPEVMNAARKRGNLCVK